MNNPMSCDQTFEDISASNEDGLVSINKPTGALTQFVSNFEVTVSEGL